MRNKKIIVSIISIILVTTTTAFYLGFNLGTKNIADADLITTLRNKTSDGELKLFSQDVQLAQTVDFAPFWKTWEVLDKNYIPVSTSSQDMIPDDKKVIKAIQGLVSSYNDPYTIFFSPEEAKIFKEQTDGSFEGIGAILRDINGSIIVENLLKDMPAQKAGIKPGDTILSIDKKKILGMDLQQVVKMIRGPKDSVVIIKVKHMKQIVPVDIKVTRGKVSLPSTTQAIVSKVEDSVKRVINQIQSKAGAILSNNDLKSDDNGLYDSIGAKDFYVFGLTTFSKSSTEAFREEVLNFNKSETNNIIFDLRNNGGGYVDVVVDMASYFLPEGEIIFTEKRGKNNEEIVYKSKGYKLLKNPEKLRLVILVNENTASAAEILAGALRDHDKAIIVGSKTFGKGSMQELINITDTMSLKVTVARWYTPKGISISGKGIVPDHIIVSDEDNTKGGIDPVFEKAIEVILSMPHP